MLLLCLLHAERVPPFLKRARAHAGRSGTVLICDCRRRVYTRSMSNYHYTVEWSQEDEEFLARVAEFPSLSAFGDTQEEALREIRMVVDAVVEDMRENGEPIPEPLP